MDWQGGLFISWPMFSQLHHLELFIYLATVTVSLWRECNLIENRWVGSVQGQETVKEGTRSNRRDGRLIKKSRSVHDVTMHF